MVANALGWSPAKMGPDDPAAFAEAFHDATAETVEP